MKELRAAVKAALERMESAHKALDEAGDGADIDALTRTFDEAEAEHTAAKAKLERAKRVAEAREAAPVEPVEEDEVPAEAEPGEPGEGEERTRGTRVRIRKEPLTYDRNNGNSVFADLARAKVSGDESSKERLSRHRKEMEVEERAHPNQAAGEGGEFIAPIWMQDEWIKLPRAGRAVADSLNRKPHPGSNQVNLPKVKTGTATATQSDGGEVKSQDASTEAVTGQSQTIAGQQDVSMQLVDLASPGMDEVLFDDLGRDYNQRVDILALTSSVTNAKGLLQLSGTNGITFTQATPTVPLLYPKIANGIVQVHTGIFRPPSVIAMHPRRWGFHLASLDGNSRPLITPYAGQNQAGRLDRVASEAQVGEIQGVPVIVDANIPTNEGAGTNQDPILIYSADDLYLFEDETPKLRVLDEVLSGTLQVRFQVYGYVIPVLGRLPKAISKITGTGLAEPAF